jgi:MBG domain (YGX type)/Cadherin-like domain
VRHQERCGRRVLCDDRPGATTANSVIKLTDTAGYNTTIAITSANNVTLYTAPTGAIIKGVAFAPKAAAVVAQTTTSLLTSSANPLTFNQSVTFTASVQTNGVTAGNFVISQAALGITANNTNKIYDGVPFSGGNGVTYSGFVNGETSSVLGGSLSFGGTSQGATYAGSYTIIPSGLTSGNYAISYTNGTLTIGKATPSFNLLSSANPSGYKDTLSFTANSFAADLTGSVQFTTNGINFGGAVAISSASATSSGTAGIPRGTANTVAAIYSGDGNYLSFTNSLTQVVTNHPPVANNLAVTRAAGSATLKIAVSSLLANVTDSDGDTVALSNVSNSTNGITPVISGLYVFYQNTNYLSDQFTYTVSDGFGGTASALVNVSVNTNGVSGQAKSIAIVGGTATLQFGGIPGYTYAIKRSTNLLNWVTIATTNPVAGVFQYVDDFSDLGNNPPAAAYYRLEWNP